MPRRPKKSDPENGRRSFDEIRTSSKPANGLTPIPQRIHCAATNQGGENSELDEVQQLQINHFLNTLADIALAVAARQAASEGGEVECER